ncbi:MAG: hypothetical protein R2734_02310 [Nocardioides sp.]
MIELRTPAQIEQVTARGRFVAEVLTELVGAADVGVNLLARRARAPMIRDRGAESLHRLPPLIRRIAVRARCSARR